MAAFRLAAAHTDPKKLHLAAAAMFGRTGRIEAARTLLKAACRKFGGSAKVRTSSHGSILDHTCGTNRSWARAAAAVLLQQYHCKHSPFWIPHKQLSRNCVCCRRCGCRR